MEPSTIAMPLLRSIIQFAVSQGASHISLCAAAGITPAELDEPDAVVTSHVAGRVWRRAVEQTGDPDFGLHLGEHTPLAALGLVGHVMQCSNQLGDAFATLLRYSNLLTNGLRGYLRTAGSTTAVEFQVSAEFDNELLREPRHPVECTVGTLVALVPQLTGRRLPVIETRFPHAAPDSIREHHRLLGPNVRFSSPMARLTFPASALTWPVLHSERILHGTLELEAAAQLGRRRSERRWIARVQEAAARQFQGALPSVSSVSRVLGVSPRSLQRHVRREGSTVRTAIDAARRALARRHLANPEISITEVSILLGFSEPSAFYRWFTRWARQTPGRYRSSLRRSSSERG